MRAALLYAASCADLAASMVSMERIVCGFQDAAAVSPARYPAILAMYQPSAAAPVTPAMVRIFPRNGMTEFCTNPKSQATSGHRLEYSAGIMLLMLWKVWLPTIQKSSGTHAYAKVAKIFNKRNVEKACLHIFFSP